MFEMRSEGRGRPAERRAGFSTEERDEPRPRGGREEPEDTRKWQSDRESEAKRQRHTKVRSWQMEEECVGPAALLPTLGCGDNGKMATRMGKEVGFKD